VLTHQDAAEYVRRCGRLPALSLVRIISRAHPSLAIILGILVAIAFAAAVHHFARHLARHGTKAPSARQLDQERRVGRRGGR
jgi:hypothetical protein